MPGTPVWQCSSTNAPRVRGFEPATVTQLAQIDNIIGVKDSMGDMTNIEEYLRLTRGMDNFHVLMGRDTLIYASLCYGAIASCANVALRIATNMGTFPVVLKEALRLIVHNCGDCVKPIQPLSEGQREKLRGVLSGMGLL